MPFSVETLKAGTASLATSIFGGTSNSAVKQFPTTRNTSARPNNSSPSKIPLGTKSEEDYRNPFESLFIEYFGLESSDLKELDALMEDIATDRDLNWDSFLKKVTKLNLKSGDLKEWDALMEDIATDRDLNWDSFLEKVTKLNLNDEKDTAAFCELVKKDIGPISLRFEQKMASSPFFKKLAILNPPAAMAAPAIQSKMAIARAVTTPTTHISEENVNLEVLAKQNDSISPASSGTTPYRLDIEETAFALLEIPQVETGSTNQTVVSKIASPIVTRNETVIANLNKRSKDLEKQQKKIEELENKNTKLENENAELKSQNAELEQEVRRNGEIITELRQEVTQNGELIQQQQLINQNLLDGLNALHKRFDAFEQSRSSSRTTSRSSRSRRSDRNDTASFSTDSRPLSPSDLIDRAPILPTVQSYEPDPSSSQHLPSYSSSSRANQAFIMPRVEVESEYGYSSEEESSGMHASAYTISDSGGSSYIAMSPRSLPDNHAHSVA